MIHPVTVKVKNAFLDRGGKAYGGGVGMPEKNSVFSVDEERCESVKIVSTPYKNKKHESLGFFF